MAETRARFARAFEDAFVIFVLGAFAFGQPLLDLLGRYPEFFVARHARPGDLIFLIAVLFLAVPAFLLCLLNGAVAFAAPTRPALRSMLVASLAALAVFPILQRVPGVPGFAVLGIGSSIGCALAWALERYAEARSAVYLLAISCVVFPLRFLARPSIAALLRPPAAAEGAADASKKARPPVVMVILDELPLASLLNDQKRIDPVLYPNIASLAGDGTWYRNAASVSGRTPEAVPAILTGKFPAGRYLLPDLQDHPDNLFTLLGPYYRLNVLETVTSLAPAAAATEGPDDYTLGRLYSMLRDCSILWLHVVSPPVYRARLPDIAMRFEDFGSGESSAWLNAALHLETDRSQAFDRFIASISGAPGNSLDFFHIEFPHFPWMYVPSGKTYLPSPPSFDVSNQVWTDSAAGVAAGYQRHLLQLQYTDKLVGRLLDHLKKVGLYDRALIVLTADHGASFRPGLSMRRADTGNVSDLVSVPLFMKEPFQKQGAVSDRAVSTVDILPTIASIAGVPLTTPVDGVSMLGTPAPADRERVFFGDRREPGSAPDRFVVGGDLFARLRGPFEMKALFGADSNDPERLFKRGGDFEALIGRRVSDYPQVREDGLTVKVENAGLYRSVSLRDPALPLLAEGTVAAPVRYKEASVVVAVNGVIRCIGAPGWREGGRSRFSCVIPDSALKDGDNLVEAFLLSGSGPDGLRLVGPPAGAAVETASSDSLLDAKNGALILADGSHIRLGGQDLIGEVDKVESNDSGEVDFSGWAIDPKNEACAPGFLAFEDGRQIAEFKPSVRRPGLASEFASPGFEPCGFTLSLPAQPFGRSSGSGLRIFALSKGGSATELNYIYGFPGTVEAPSRYTLSTDALGLVGSIRNRDGSVYPVEQGAVSGNLDQATELNKDFMLGSDVFHRLVVFSGWAADTRNAEVPERLVLFIDGRSVFTFRASRYRKDVARFLGRKEYEKSGFVFELPRTVVLKSGDPQVRVFAITKDGRAGELNYYAGYPWAGWRNGLAGIWSGAGRLWSRVDHHLAGAR